MHKLLFFIEAQPQISQVSPQIPKVSPQIPKGYIYNDMILKDKNAS